MLPCNHCGIIDVVRHFLVSTRARIVSTRLASSSAASGLSMNRERRGGESSRVPFACGFRYQPVMLDARDGQDKRRQDNRLGAANIQSPGREKQMLADRRLFI